MKQLKILKLYKNYLFRRGTPLKQQIEYTRRIELLYLQCNKYGRNWKSLSYEDIDNYVQSLKKQGLKHNSICTTISIIKSFIKFCNLEHNLTHISSSKIYLPKMEFTEARYLTEDDLCYIMRKLETKKLRFRVALMLLISTGARIQEVCNITRKQLNDALLVGNNYQISIIGKRKITRPLFISKDTYNLCKLFLSTHRKNTVLGLKKQTLTDEIRKFSRAIQLKFTAHTFRHTFITELAKKGTAIYLIAKLAGHTNINTTSRYLHSANYELSEVVNVLHFR